MWEEEEEAEEEVEEEEEEEVEEEVEEEEHQIRYGEDLMSRVSYAMLHPEGAEKMTAAVREAVRDLVARTASDAGGEPEDVLEITLVGNPVMHHLLLGIDPTQLGGAPFALATDEAVAIWFERCARAYTAAAEVTARMLAES